MGAFAETLRLTLPTERRTEGSGLYNLLRNIGSSVGVSAVNSLRAQNAEVNHAAIAQLTAVNHLFENPVIVQFWNLVTAARRAAARVVVIRQAQIIAYIDDYELSIIATLVVIPLLIVFKKPSHDGGMDRACGVEL